MFFKILKKDFQRNKVITIALFTFIIISSLLVASGTSIIIELFSSIDNLFDKSNVSHFVQMHSGTIDRSEIDTFASENELVKDHQIVEMINIDGSNIFFGNSLISDKNSVMDNGFVKQNNSFDLLLNLNNEVIKVSEGDIAVPIYYLQEKNLEIGDAIRISNGSFDRVFIISDFVRDAQMNPSIITSKRFVVNDEDFDILNKNIGKIEYLIEFQIKDLNDISKFTNDYQSFNLPQKGPTVDYSLFRVMNALSDGMVAVVIILVSILLIIIALLCLRFTILTTMEEDYKEIGVMKAIGITQKDIKRIYLIKYIVMTAVACIVGYLLSISVSELFTSNISLYIGIANKNILHFIIPLLSSFLLFMIVIFLCAMVIRRFRKISAVQALRSGAIGNRKVNTKIFPLRKSRFLNLNVFLGIKDVFSRLRMYLLLLIIFAICSFIIIIPINFLNTIESPKFISYMGVGKSDIRIDLQLSNEIIKEFNDINDYIEKDKDVDKFSPLITSKYRVLNNDGVWQNINVETGDFTIFPLEYLEGEAPIEDNEIALSLLNANDLGKALGDKLFIMKNERKHEMVVSGIYQDVTNGGKTAKASISYNPDTIIWFNISLSLKENVNINNKIIEYKNNFPSAKITCIEDYLKQTFGTTIKQVRLVTLLSIVIAILISILITSLFMKMLIAKDTYQIAIMRSMGFTYRKIQIQYIVRTLIVLGIGIIGGMLLSNTIGEGLVGILMSFIGASKIELVINPIVSYILCPFALMFIVTITTRICTKSIKKIDVTKML